MNTLPIFIDLQFLRLQYHKWEGGKDKMCTSSKATESIQKVSTYEIDEHKTSANPCTIDALKIKMFVWSTTLLFFFCV